ncbi:AraC family transcriptional regulator [Shimia sagamensis]|uniref:Transcriptional regulator, AraC family n=1 Tax=Shimia sagamensis TaxID=1566352 RepID=A0ABY1NLT1_9RHOB|nr:AraC family transcriptional regulator [Shimia sagamensis]SMP13187.1 transcriptional regulator, AraC family [Shimia sagamensis]
MDRLTTLVEKFHLSVQPATLSEANLIAKAGNDGTPARVVFFTRGACTTICAGEVLFAAHVDWMGLSNPLMAALPEEVHYDLSGEDDSRALVRLMAEETNANRCGAQSVINRLGEALMVRLLRDQISQGTTDVGLLAGLADPRLSRAIVAMHDFPGRVWSNADLAQEAGLSLSRFSELFAQTVGETPMGYLRRWRLILAHQDITRGDRVDAVARRYAYRSPESFTRAFRKAHGVAPTSLRAA